MVRYIVHKSGERKAKSMSTAKMDQALLKAVKAVVTVNRELHGTASDRSCRHIELDLKGKGVQYSTGDHIAILPRNRSVTPPPPPRTTITTTTTTKKKNP
jgi:sulfite reductase alpha subunit-like flavoprotein